MNKFLTSMSLIAFFMSFPLYADVTSQCQKTEGNKSYIEVVCPPLKLLDKSWDEKFKPPKPYLDASLAYQSGTTGTSGTSGTIQGTSGSSGTTSGTSSDSTFQELESQTWQ